MTLPCLEFTFPFKDLGVLFVMDTTKTGRYSLSDLHDFAEMVSALLRNVSPYDSARVITSYCALSVYMEISQWDGREPPSNVPPSKLSKETFLRIRGRRKKRKRELSGGSADGMGDSVPQLSVAVDSGCEDLTGDTRELDCTTPPRTGIAFAPSALGTPVHNPLSAISGDLPPRNVPSRKVDDPLERDVSLLSADHEESRMGNIITGEERSIKRKWRRRALAMGMAAASGDADAKAKKDDEGEAAVLVQRPKLLPSKRAANRGFNFLVDWLLAIVTANLNAVVCFENIPQHVFVRRQAVSVTSIIFKLEHYGHLQGLFDILQAYSESLKHMTLEDTVFDDVVSLNALEHFFKQATREYLAVFDELYLDVQELAEEFDIRQWAMCKVNPDAAIMYEKKRMARLEERKALERMQ